MNLIFFYVSDQSCNKSISLSEIESQPATNKFAINLQSDGVYVLLDLLAATKVVDHIYCIIDSKKGNGVLNPTKDTTIYCVPNINFVFEHEIVQPNDILFFRGGFRAWLPALNWLQQAYRKFSYADCSNKQQLGLSKLPQPFWKLYYRANTNHGHWPYWDIILDDLIEDKNHDWNDFHFAMPGKKERFVFPYRKPVNEYIFKPIIPADHKYDIMFGASHIHTKKGQHIALQACNYLAASYKTFKDLKYIMPGAPIRCGTNKIIEQSWPIWLYKPGFQKRPCLARMYNNTKLFIHAGPGGQNDRSVLEALACGIPVMVKDPKRYSPWVQDNEFVTICNSDVIEDWGAAIIKAWAKIPTNWHEFNDYRKRLSDWYRSVNGLWEVALTRMNHLVMSLKHAKPGDFNKVIENLEKFK